MKNYKTLLQLIFLVLIMIGHSIATAVEEYALLGLDTVPTQPNLNVPLLRNWPKLSSAEMWAMAQNYHAFDDLNISIRCGGEYQLVVIDGDEKNHPGTCAFLERYFAQCGFYPGDYPKVRTKSIIGFQYYFRLAELLSGHYKLLNLSFGAGEIRYGQGAVVLAPPSRMDGQLIELVSGDFRQIPLLKVADILHLFADQTFIEKVDDGSGKRPSIPRETMILLNGGRADKYRSRSDMAQAILTGLACVHFSFDDVYELFLCYPAAGKFSELHQKDKDNARRWLKHSYENAIEFVANNERQPRIITAVALEEVEAAAWPGRTGSNDKAILKAHLHLAHRAGKIVYAASARDLAELAGISHVAASSATTRLIEQRWLKLEKPAVGNLAKVYKLRFDNLNLTLPHKKGDRECKLFAAHDAFRHGGGLGKSAAEIYEVLLQQKATAKELQKATGRTIGTIRNKLNRMANLVDATTGEIISMVNQVGDEWEALEVNLDYVALIVGTAGKGAAQRKQHKQQRERFKQQLLVQRVQKHRNGTAVIGGENG